MEIFKEILLISRDIIVVLGLPLLIYRIWIMKNAFEQDHENMRNSKAVDLIKEWTKSLNSKSSTARKLVEMLDHQTCISLNKQEKIEIVDSEQNKNYLKIIFEKDFEPNNSKIALDVDNSSKLRWEIITYLNTLESVFTAYRNNVADKTMLKEQFEYLVKPEENQFVLEAFRKAIGKNSYPGIRDFVDELKNDKEKKKEGKSKTGLLRKFRKK